MHYGPTAMHAMYSEKAVKGACLSESSWLQGSKTEIDPKKSDAFVQALARTIPACPAANLSLCSALLVPSAGLRGAACDG